MRSAKLANHLKVLYCAEFGTTINLGHHNENGLLQNEFPWIRILRPAHKR